MNRQHSQCSSQGGRADSIIIRLFGPDRLAALCALALAAILAESICWLLVLFPVIAIDGVWYHTFP